MNSLIVNNFKNESLDDRLSRVESMISDLPAYLDNLAESVQTLVNSTRYSETRHNQSEQRIDKMVRAVQELTGYNPDQDRDLVLECGTSLR